MQRKIASLVPLERTAPTWTSFSIILSVAFVSKDSGERHDNQNLERDRRYRQGTGPLAPPRGCSRCRASTEWAVEMGGDEATCQRLPRVVRRSARVEGAPAPARAGPYPSMKPAGSTSTTLAPYFLARSYSALSRPRWTVLDFAARSVPLACSSFLMAFTVSRSEPRA